MKMVRYKQGELPPLTEVQKAELKVLSEKPDSEIDCSDIPELDDAFWERSVLWKDVMRSGLFDDIGIHARCKLMKIARVYLPPRQHLRAGFAAAGIH